MKKNIYDLMDEIIINLEKIKKLDYDFGLESEKIFSQSLMDCLDSNNISITNIYNTLKKLKNL